MLNRYPKAACIAALTALPVFALTLVVTSVTLIMVPLSTAQAAGGQCKWENGAGAPTYPACSVEDCIGRGGKGRCSTGAGAVQNRPDAEVGPDKWVFSAHDDYYNPIFTNPYWCRAAGGWFGSLTPYGNPTCHDLPEDVLGDRAANTESRLLEIVENFADAWAGRGSSCGGAATKQSDTGWVLQAQSLGVGTTYERDMVYKGVSCSTTVGISLFKRRNARCAPPATQRTAAVTGAECFTPAEVCSEFGNPVSAVTGAKYQREVDYAPAADTGLELVRHYKSSGYLRPKHLGGSGMAADMTADDFWGHTYDRRLILATGNAEVLGIARRPDCSLLVFDTSGAEITNLGGVHGSGARLDAFGSGWKVSLPNGDVEQYDSAGRLTAITTVAGRATTLSYGGNGKLATVAGPFGHTLTFSYSEYDGVEVLTSVTLPDNSVISYDYDTWRRPVSVTYPDGTSRQYQYGDVVNRWQLTGIIDENGQQFSTYVYDSAGRVTSESHAGGVNSYQFSYTTVGGLPATTITDPLGTSSQLRVAAANGAYRRSTFLQQCFICGEYASTTYDVRGNPATRTDFNGDQIVYTFDATRNLETSRTEASGTPAARTVSTQWHPTFRLPAEITEPGRITAFTYDGGGNLLTQTVTDTATSESRTWTFSYTGLGQLLTADGPRTDVSDITTLTYYTCSSGAQCGQLYTVTDAANNVTTYGSYNAHGLPLSITDPNGTLISLAYDDRQRVTSRTIAGETTGLEYWPTGLLKKVTKPDGSFVSYGYDAAQRLTSTTDTLGNTITYTLNGAGQRLTEEVRDSTNALTFKRTRVYNALGRLVEERGDGGQITSFGYDADGNLTEIEDPLGRVTTHEYDELDRLATLVDAALQTTNFSYDGRNNLLSVLDPRELLTSYTHNGFDEQISQASPDTGASSSPRDAAGNLAITTDARNKTASYIHDALNRVTEVEYADETATFGYDLGANGAERLTSMADDSGQTSWSYDAAGRVTERSQATGAVTLDIAYGYDTYGRLSSLTTPSGQTLTYEYTNGLLSGLKVNGSWVLSQLAYQPFGPVKNWTWGNGASTSRSYDIDGQLTQVASAGTSTFSYHLDGRIASRSDDFTAPPSTASGTTIFVVDSDSNHLEGATGLINRSYGYDAAGNTTSDGARTFTYSDAGRMKTSTNAGMTTTYSYNGLGERVRKTNSGSTTHFSYDEAGHLIGEYDAVGGLIQETVWLGDIPVAVLKSDGGSGIDVYYIHTDHLNTPRRITRPSDNEIVWRWDSDPFGSTAANEDPDGDMSDFAYPLRFPGQYLDEETGLHYNYYRDYDPVTGRYVQSDPIGLDGGINTYAYATGNPLRFIDSLGLDIAVIENGPTEGNPIGHTAIAVTGAGLYSFGNNWPGGGSLIDYLRREAPRRNTKISVIKTTPAQDAAALAYLRQFPDTTLPGDFWSVYFFDNCSTRSNRALDAAGVLGFPMDLMSQPQPYNVPGSSSLRSGGQDAAQYFIPRNATSFPLELSLFEPR
jgi:RHS repeat-associated protein